MLEQQLTRIGDERTCPTMVLMKGRSLLLGLRNYTPEKWKDISVWITPGGRCDPGETLEQTLRREVLEEVNITRFDIKAMIGEVPGAKEGDIVPIFFGTTEEEPTLMEPQKFQEWRWVLDREYNQGHPYDIVNPAAHGLIRDFLENTLAA